MVAVVFDKAGNNVFFKKSANIKTPEGPGRQEDRRAAGRLAPRAVAGVRGDATSSTPNGVTLVNVKPEGKQAIVAAGEVDASFDLYTSYAIWEKVLGKGEVGHLLWADYGLPIYGHTYFVNNDLVKKNPKLIERFLRATHKGWRDAQGQPGRVDRRDGRAGARPRPRDAARRPCRRSSTCASPSARASTASAGSSRS